MAKIGYKEFYWSKMDTEPENSVPTYKRGKKIGKAVSCNVAITNAEGELYADDQLAEYIGEFSSGQLTAAVDHIALEDQAEVYGAQYVDDELLHNSNDTAPNGGTGGYQVLIHENVKSYRAWMFTKVKASIPDEDSTTRGNNVSFGTQPINMKIMSPKFGPWKRVKEFARENDAKAYLQTLLNIGEWVKAQVMIQGDGTASHNGSMYAAKGDTMKITMSKTPTAVYDNAVNVTDSVSGNAYTISNMDAEHRIAIIF